MKSQSPPHSALSTQHSALRPRVKPRFGSAADAATRSGLSVRTLRRLIARGELAASRVGRRVLVDLVELDRYVKRRASKARPAFIARLDELPPAARALVETSPEPHGDETWEVPI